MLASGAAAASPSPADPAPAAPAVAPASADPASPSPAPSDDWRALRSGGDPKKLEALSRYKTEADWQNSWFEQRAALAKRAEPVRLAENATPEQVAEYRKGLGLPEVAKDAKADAYVEAYKIAAPQGYEMGEVEKGMIGDFAKLAYEKGMDPAAVKGATDFFFQQQSAMQQAVNRSNLDKQTEWQAELKAEFGRDYDAHIAAAQAYMDKLVGGDDALKAMLVNAQLPGGGLVGDHPVFAKAIIDLALQNGFGDRIQANAYESGGKSLEQQQTELEALRLTDSRRYNDPKVQAQLDKIISLRLARGEIDEQGRRRRA